MRSPGMGALARAVALLLCAVGTWAVTPGELEVWRILPSIQPPLPLYTWKQPDPQAAVNDTMLLGSLGASQEGMRYALRNNLFRLAEGLPPELLQEPGMMLLTNAIEAYYMFYPGVDSVVRAPVYQYWSGMYASMTGANQTMLNSIWKPMVAQNGSGIGNMATFYAGLFFDLDMAGGPMVLEIPPAPEGAYWLCPFADWYQEIWGTIGTRLGQAGGRWLIVPPGYAGPLYGFREPYILRSPNAQFMILGRALNSKVPGFDPNAWQATWKMVTPDGSPVPSADDFGYSFTDPVLALKPTNMTDPLYFWQAAGELFQRDPKFTLEDPLLYQLPKLGLSAAQGFTPENVSDVGLLALEWAIPIAARLIEARYLSLIGTPEQNYWYLPTTNERWGYDFGLGAAIMKGAWILNQLEDAAYYFNYLSKDGVPLNGSATYTIDFPSKPPANPLAFWAVQVVTLDVLAYPNSEAPFVTGENRFLWTQGYLEGPSVVSISNNTRVNADGSFRVILSPTKPPQLGPGDNWLDTSVFKGMSTYLYMRVYWPDEIVLQNQWVPPPVVPAAS